MAKSPPLSHAQALRSIESALRRLDAIEAGQPTEAHAATLRELQEAREEIAILAQRNAEIIADADRWRSEAGAARSIATTDAAPSDHDGLCWRALRDAIVSMCGATKTEGDGDPDHPLGEIAYVVLQDATSLGALSCAQIIASELHGLARDAVAWRRFVADLGGDLQSNESDRESIATTMHSAIAKAERDHRTAEYDRTHTCKDPRRSLATWAAWNAWTLGDDLSRAAGSGLCEAQGISDADAKERDRLEGESEEKPDPRDYHAVWWRTFVATVCGSAHEDGDARRLAWALRRSGAPVASCDDTIDTVESCAAAISTLLDRMEVGRVA